MTTQYLESIEKELSLMLPDRHDDLLHRIAEYIVKENKTGNKAQLNFICTHNSRRSQFTQTWCSIVQAWKNIDIADAYSGGTEVTACNERTVAALERAGCKAEKEGNENPVYTVKADNFDKEIKLWSKVYDDDANPDERFAAVMTCDHADANCPFIPGASKRFPLTYTDPKYADDTDQEEIAYDMTCKMIATDMIRLFKKVEELQ